MYFLCCVNTRVFYFRTIFLCDCEIEKPMSASVNLDNKTYVKGSDVFVAEED